MPPWLSPSPIPRVARTPIGIAKPITGDIPTIPEDEFLTDDEKKRLKR